MSMCLLFSDVCAIGDYVDKHWVYANRTLADSKSLEDYVEAYVLWVKEKRDRLKAKKKGGWREDDIPTPDVWIHDAWIQLNGCERLEVLLLAKMLLVEIDGGRDLYNLLASTCLYVAALEGRQDKIDRFVCHVAGYDDFTCFREELHRWFCGNGSSLRDDYRFFKACCSYLTPVINPDDCETYRRFRRNIVSDFARISQECDDHDDSALDCDWRSEWARFMQTEESILFLESIAEERRCYDVNEEEDG